MDAPEVTSTSTGRMMNWSSSGALVLILMKAVWLSTSLDEKLALITPFVSNGGISWKTGRRQPVRIETILHQRFSGDKGTYP